MKLVLAVVLCVLNTTALATSPLAAQTIVSPEDDNLQIIGSVRIGSEVIQIVVGYSFDSAVMSMSVDDGKYVPLFVSTYRGVPDMKVDIFTSSSRHEVWVFSPTQGETALAYFKFGMDTALTSFGKQRLRMSPFPEALSGGPTAFPPFIENSVVKKASFYHFEGED